MKSCLLCNALNQPDAKNCVTCSHNFPSSAAPINSSNKLSVLWWLLPAIFVFFIFVFWLAPTDAKRSPVNPPPVAESFNRTPLGAAASTVGIDDGLRLPSTDDIRVKRASFLIESLMSQTGEPPDRIASAIDSASDYIENHFGKKVLRQDILEDMHKVYSDPKLKATLKGESFKEITVLYVVSKYGK